MNLKDEPESPAADSNLRLDIMHQEPKASNNSYVDSINKDYTYEHPLSQSPAGTQNFNDGVSRPDAQTVTTKVISYKGSSEENYPKASSAGFDSPSPAVAQATKKAHLLDPQGSVEFGQRGGSAG